MWSGRDNNGNHPIKAAKRKTNFKKMKAIWEICGITLSIPTLAIIGIPEGEEREKGIKNVFEKIMAEKFPNLKKETDIQILEAQGVPNKMNSNRPTPRHIIIKMAKIKERILKAPWGKQKVIYKGNTLRLSTDFFAEILQSEEWQSMFKVLKGKSLQPMTLYPGRISFRIERKIKNFSDKQKLRVHQ